MPLFSNDTDTKTQKENSIIDFSKSFSALKNLVTQLPEILTFPIKLSFLGKITDIGQRGVKMTWPQETVRIVQSIPQEGIFHTGIESSDPLVDGVRRNQLIEAYNFHENYEKRLERIANLGIKWLRFGTPYSQTHLGPHEYDFSLMDKVVKKSEELGITIIADLLHFGLPDWLHAENTERPHFQNPAFPEAFARYAAVFAKRYPHIKYITIINEPFVTANLSAKIGLWNETRKSDWHDDRDFVRAEANIARAAILARIAIENVWVEQNRVGEPIFVQNESFEVALAAPGSSREAEARQFNIRRFTALDLILGYRDPQMKQYLLDQGMSEAEYEWFMARGDSTKTILGIDHYPWCVYTLESNEQVNIDPLQRYQLYELAKFYWHRYKTPLLHTEINAPPELATAMCQKTYDVLQQLRNEGYPVLGMGWYGDEYQVGWQTALTGPGGYEEYPVGLHYKGEPQPVAVLFQQLASKGLVPVQNTHSVNLRKRLFFRQPAPETTS